MTMFAKKVINSNCCVSIARQVRAQRITSSCTSQIKHFVTSATTYAKDLKLSYVTYPNTTDVKEDRSKVPLILLHGLFGAKGNFHSICKQLSSNGRKVIAFDARNHGESEHSGEHNYQVMRDDLADIIEDLMLQQPVVFGHSMGGKTAMMLALSRPELLSALIVGDVSPGMSPGGNTMKNYIHAMKELDLTPDAGIVAARRQAALQMSSRVPDKGILQFLLTNLREIDGRVAWRINLDSLLDNYSSIMGFPGDSVQNGVFAKPTLFIYGQNSAHYTCPSREKIKDFFPDAQTSVIPGAGHFIHAEKPLEFLTIMNEFLSTIDSRTS